MFKEEYETLSNVATNKIRFLKKNKVGMFVMSMMAGAYIGFGILLSFTVGGALTGLPARSLVMGACFGSALSLVVIAGAELFTGNNLVMTAGLLKGKVTFRDVLQFWILCWIGNLAGGMILGILFHLAGLNTGVTAETFHAAALAKTSTAWLPLFVKGILCNTLVCIATWCGTKCKSESGKLIMIFWCLLIFFTCGFEHSIANMTVFMVALCSHSVTLGGCIYNLCFVTLGNMVGGILFVAVPYYLASKER